MKGSRGRSAPADQAPLKLAVLRIGQAAVGPAGELRPAVTLDGRGLSGAAEPRELTRRLRRGFRCTVVPTHIADGVRFTVTFETPLALRFAFEIRYTDPFGDAFIGGAMITGAFVVNFNTQPAVSAATPEGTSFVETEGLVLPLEPGALVPPPARRRHP